MKKFQIFVDGAAGTTGLRILERLEEQPDITLLALPEESRKDLDARVAAVNKADLSILCLPDDAAAEIAALAKPEAKICDTSTAHRTKDGWVYGFPELANRKEQLKAAARVAVPGCHASGFLALVTPLVEQTILPKNTTLSCHSLTGYSGGGKQMIAAYENPERSTELTFPRLYGLTMTHKHLPEMKAISGLENPPLFSPVVADFYSGMLVHVSLETTLLSPSCNTPQKVALLLKNYYQSSPFLTVHPAGLAPKDGMIAAGNKAGQDDMEIFVLGNEEQILLVARYDNLGKGASGAAIQCMNTMLGREETAGLCLGRYL